MKSLFFFILLFSNLAMAHPVIYQGGWAVNSSNMPVYSNNYLMYSLTSKLAVGLNHWRFGQNQDNDEAVYVKVNHLLMRKNLEDSQANLYLHAGLGFEDKESGTRNQRGAHILGIEGDWESRVLYTSLKYLNFTDSNLTQGRVGFSPRLRGFDELQTWFILQGMVIKGYQDEVMLTPMLRFFYQNILWEMGSSTRGEWMLNFMVHY